MKSIIDWLESSLEKIEHKIFEDVIKIEDADKKPIGDGQVVVISDIGRITLTLTTKNGEKKHLKAIIKCEAKAPVGKHLAQMWGAFDTEIMMYSEVLKRMESLMSQFDDKAYLWAQCYHCGDNKLLFEDLCEVGYQIVPTHKYLDLEHSLIVMNSIGKYHAISMVMKEKNIYDFDVFMSKEPYYAKDKPLTNERLIQRVNTLINVIKAHWGPEWLHITKKLENYFRNPKELIYNAWNESRGKWDVLNHGDFSMRNMLFHYPTGSSHPDGIKFVDFQMCHYSNLANDLITLLYSSLRTQVREENMDLLLNTYIKSLSTTSKRYGFKGQTPTLQDVKSAIVSLHPIIFFQILFFVPWFIRSGKEDLNKKTNERIEKFESWEEATKEQNRDESENDFIAFSDEDVKEVLQYEFNLLLKENILL